MAFPFLTSPLTPLFQPYIIYNAYEYQLIFTRTDENPSSIYLRLTIYRLMIYSNYNIS